MSTKQLLVIVSAALGLLLLVGCSSLRDKLNILTGSGNPVTREFDFSDFDEVAIENAFEGTITRGDVYRVVVTVDDNLLDVLEVGQNGNRVTLGLRDATVVANANLSFEITMPALRVLEASGASRAQITGFDSSDDLRAGASGASRIEGDINSSDANFNASGASTITLRGAGGDLQAEGQRGQHHRPDRLRHRRRQRERQRQQQHYRQHDRPAGRPGDRRIQGALPGPTDSGHPRQQREQQHRSPLDAATTGGASRAKLARPALSSRLVRNILPIDTGRGRPLQCADVYIE